MTNTLDLLSQFEDEITTSNRLPYLQIQNPPNLSLADIKKYGAPFGWFIPVEQSELTAFSQEVRSFRREIEEVFFKSINKPVKALTDRAHALTVLNLQFDVHKSEGKSPFIYPSVRFAPALDKIGEETVVTRRDRKVTLVNQPIESLLISKTSDTGKSILGLWEEHQDFSTKYQNDVVEPAPEEEADMSASEFVEGSIEPPL